MRNEETLRKSILNMVTDYWQVTKDRASFVEGKSPVHYAGRVYDSKELVNLVDASLDFWLTAGRYAQRFEKEFAQFVGTKYALLTNSGSSANLLAISALTSPLLGKRRLKPGDEVITTACGFPTTLNPIIQNNCVPVFVDVELGTYNIQAEKIEKAITKKTRAIIVAHTLGNPVNIGLISRIAKKHKLWFVEDSCDALGSKYSGRNVGTFGDISTFSFYPAHHMTMGEGGAVLTNDPILRRCILSFRDWGRDCWCDPGRDNTCGHRFTQKFGDLPCGYDHKYVYSHIGYNLKVTDMQAAIGCAQLKKLPGFIKARQNNFAYLTKALKKYEKYLLLPQATPKTVPSWFGFPILVKDNKKFNRADIVNYLENKKVATRMLFGGNLVKQPAYKNVKYKVSGKLANTDLVMNHLFWIGVYPGLSNSMLNYMVKTFDGFFGEKI